MSLTSNLEIKKITKESIQTALILLLKEKKWDDITINNIVEKAGVSRMAYYRNYKSKDDILTDIFDDFMTKLMKYLSLICKQNSGMIIGKFYLIFLLSM